MAIKAKRREDRPYVSCPLCDEFIKVRENKKGKPYLRCDDCGILMFINGEKGQDRLAKLFNREVNSNV